MTRTVFASTLTDSFSNIKVGLNRPSGPDPLLDGLFIHGAAADFRVAFGGSCRIHVPGSVQFARCAPRFAGIACLGIRCLCQQGAQGGGRRPGIWLIRRANYVDQISPNANQVAVSYPQLFPLRKLPLAIDRFRAEHLLEHSACLHFEDSECHL